MSTKNVGIDEKEVNRYFSVMSLSPEQCRAARGWLNWSQVKLADEAHVSESTVRDFEAGRRTPIANNLEALGRVFADAKITLIFSPDGRPEGIAGVAGDPPPKIESTKPPRRQRTASGKRPGERARSRPLKRSRG